MSELTMMIVRTIFLYLLILIIFRLMGKREIGELSVFDLVVNIMIAEMAVMAIEETTTVMLHSVASNYFIDDDSDNDGAIIIEK